MKKKISLEVFIDTCQSTALHESPLYIFSAQEYPSLFFSALLQKLRDSYLPPAKTVVYEDRPFSSLMAQLSTTFLGQRDILWLGDCSQAQLSSADKKQLFTLCCSYQGPHVLIAYVHADDVLKDMKQVIPLDEPLSAQERKKVLSFLYPSVNSSAVEDLLKNVRSITLDHLVIIAQYATVLGKNSVQFKQQWLDQIIEPETSLFALSQYFFARKPTLFWPLWQTLKDQYAAPFWTTYWSEQLWKAHYVIQLYHEQKISDAKQFSYRLPFSFLQKDWKFVSIHELKAAHDFLYRGDYLFKNGGSELFLEVFYSMFLSKQFQ